MIITISGTAGSGKSTVAKLVAKKLGYKHYSLGDLQRTLAKQKGISLRELGELEKHDDSFDRKLDEMQRELGKKEDNFVIDGRLSFHFIPHSVKIFVTADESVRAARINKDLQAGNRTEEQTQQIVKSMAERKQQELDRWVTYYDVNPYDTTQYDFLLDSSSLSPEEMADEVMMFIAKLSESL
jgi:CMP/dCMP kinase